MFSDSDSDVEQPTNTFKDQVQLVLQINLLHIYKIRLYFVHQEYMSAQNKNSCFDCSTIICHN